MNSEPQTTDDARRQAALDEIYTISLWQPWATWILWGWKIIETRTHDRFRHLVGHRIGIHAAQKFDRDWYIHASRFMSEEKFCKTRDFEHVKGAVLCTAQVVDHARVRHLYSPEAMIECETPRYGLFLKRITPVEPPLIVKGRQGIFKVRLSPSSAASTLSGENENSVAASCAVKEEEEEDLGLR